MLIPTNGSDKMEKKTVTIVAVVLVIIIVVAAAVIIINGSGKDTSKSDVRYALQIMGNADEGLTIDSKDVNIIQEIVDGKLDFKDYPMADANNDGRVNTADVELVKDIVNRKSGITIYVVNYGISGSDDGKEIVTPVKYPLTKVVPYGVNIVEPIIAVDGGRSVAAYFSSGYPIQEASMKGVDLKGGTRSIGDAAWKNFITTDASVGFDAFILTYDARAQVLDTYREDLKASNIPLICYPAANPDGEVSAALTLGFLFGGNSEKLGQKYAEIYEDVLDDIEKKVTSKGTKEAVYLAMTMYTSICQNDSTFNTIGAAASGMPYYKTDADFAAKYKGTSSTTTKSLEAMSNLNMDVILNFRSMDQVNSSADIKDTIVETFEYTNSSGIQLLALLKTTDIYEDHAFLINNTLPAPAKVAYSAYAMYGDKLSIDWANSVMQEFIDGGFTSFAGKTIKDNIVTIFGYKDYQAAKG